MANGVPEHEVWAAADVVLARGERPTVERVRLELGRGSPARVGQLLEQWWEQLAQRLKGQALLPDLPGDVAQTFASAWRHALEHADVAAQAKLTEQHNDLFARETSLTQERKLWEIALTEAQANVADSAARLAHTELQLAERQVLNDQLSAQISDSRQHRDQLQTQLGRQHAELDALRAELASAHGHICAVEDRAHLQVDHSRQEIKELKQQHERSQREYTKQVSELVAQRDTLQAALRAAEQATAHHAGRVAALEATIARWERLPAATTRTARKPPTKKVAKPTPRSRPKVQK